MKKVLFVLSGNLSTCPRGLKAARLLATTYNVDIFYVNRSNQWLEQDKTIILPDSVHCSYLNLGRKPFWPWLQTSVIEKLSKFLYPYFKNQIDINAFGSNKSSIMLWFFHKKIGTPDFDLIMGHGAGALYPAWRLSNKWSIPFIFDVEDYHPGEFIRRDLLNEKQRREYLMKKLLPAAMAVTSASPLIEEYTLKLIGGHSRHQVVLNSFPEKEFMERRTSEDFAGGLKLVWFSQKIGFGRGLEELFDAFDRLDSNVLISLHLTLIGEMDRSFYNEVINPFAERMKSFTYKHHSPMSQAELHAELSNHDMGLALEFDRTDLNRQLCLTNKIVAYAQAGLYILATDTLAQREFITSRPWVGEVIGQSVEEIANVLMRSVEKQSNIKSKSNQRFQRSKDLAWENESGRLSALLQLA